MTRIRRWSCPNEIDACVAAASARGELIEEEALRRAIESGIVEGAGLDVFEQEPPKDWSLAQLAQVVATPHIAASTEEAQELVGTDTAATVRDFLRSGVVRNAVNFPSLQAEELQRLQPWIRLADQLGGLAAQMGTARIQAEPTTSALDRAQARLLGLWRDRQQVSLRVLAYDTTNFYTYIATTNTRTHLAQRGHNKQGRHNLRQVGLSYVLDGEHGLSLCHHVYRGDRPDVDEVSTMLLRVGQFLDQYQLPRDTVTLVMDKGAAAVATTVAATEAGFGWIAALPWTQAPADLRARPVEDLPVIPTVPGVRATAEHRLVHGHEYLCVVKYSASFAGEQLQSVTTSLAKTLQALRRLAVDLGKPKARCTEDQLRRKIDRWLAMPFLAELIHYTLESHDGRWHLQFTVDHTALQQLMAQRLGRTVLRTNRLAWTAEQVIAGYDGQQHIEQVFRGLKDGDWLGWGPMSHWTDSKIRVHAFYCLLGLSLLQTVYREAQAAWRAVNPRRLLLITHLPWVGLYR